MARLAGEKQLHFKVSESRKDRLDYPAALEKKESGAGEGFKINQGTASE